MSFDPTFRFFSDAGPIDRDAPMLDDWWQGLLVELRAELDNRQRLYPGRVAKGRMTRIEADKELRVWRSLIQSVDPLCARPAAGVEGSWTEQVHALRREIGLRRHFYPQWVLSGRVDGAEADHKLLLLEQWHDLIWHQVGTPEAVAARAATAARLADRRERQAA